MLNFLGTKAPGRLLKDFEEAEYGAYLASFYEPSIETTLRNATAMITPDQFRFFLDSGAYSAWTKGSVIDIDEYCAFIKANIEHIDVYPCLDVIPGRPGAGNATDAERESAAEATWRNYLYMVREGLDPIPVFHYGEDWRFLTRMVTHGCEYIGVGGLVGVPGPLRILWLDRLFKRLCDAEGQPIVKTHGFGMTSVPLIFRYPWYSVDSTTWIKITMSGSVMLPALDAQGRFAFDRVPMIVSVSDRSPKAGEGGKHVNTMAPTLRAILDQWLRECGKTVEECAGHYYHRAVVNVSFFKRVSEEAAVRPFKADQIRRQTFF